MVLKISGTGGEEQKVGEFLNKCLPHLEKINGIRDFFGAGEAGKFLTTCLLEAKCERQSMSYRHKPGMCDLLVRESRVCLNKTFHLLSSPPVLRVFSFTWAVEIVFWLVSWLIHAQFPSTVFQQHTKTILTKLNYYHSICLIQISQWFLIIYSTES